MTDTDSRRIHDALENTLGQAAASGLRPGFSSRLENALAEVSKAREKRRKLRLWMATYWLATLVGAGLIANHVEEVLASGVDVAVLAGGAVALLASALLYWLVALLPAGSPPRRPRGV